MRAFRHRVLVLGKCWLQLSQQSHSCTTYQVSLSGLCFSLFFMSLIFRNFCVNFLMKEDSDHSPMLRVNKGMLQTLVLETKIASSAATPIQASNCD
ncbi:hypothetical protein ABFS83_12G056400 [Erythranthe nasuta]